MNSENPYAPPCASEATASASSPQFSRTYTVSKEIQLDSVSQYFFTVMLGWRWIPIVLYALLGVLLFWASMNTFGTIVLAICGVMVLIWIKSYFACRSHALTQLAIADGNEIALEFENDGFKVVFGNSSRSTRWEKITRLKESNDYVFLMHGKIPLLTVPKAVLTSEATAFLQTLGRTPRSNIDAT